MWSIKVFLILIEVITVVVVVVDFVDVVGLLVVADHLYLVGVNQCSSDPS